MTEYNFAAQYQQNPQPPSGIIVRREWLKFYGPGDMPEKFDQKIQSWDTANKDTELANYSVCTTWGLKGQHVFLLDVFRRKLDFPGLKRAVREQAALHNATVVLVEDKASGTSLIQELRADNFFKAQAAPALDGDKVMRLHGQTAKIEGGSVLPWLDTYLHELVSFPNSTNDDQVDSTVFALAWHTSHVTEPALLQFMKTEAAKIAGNKASQNGMIRIWVPPPTSTYILITGRQVNVVSPDRIIEATEEEAIPLLQNGARRVD